MVFVRTFVLGCLLASSVVWAESPYRWRIVAPDGSVRYYDGEEIELEPLQPGLWEAHLQVSYAHEDPTNPGHPYLYQEAFEFFVTGPDLRLVFTDGFETGTTAEWSQVIGGHDE